LPICFGLPVITCFSETESNDLNSLIVISFDLVRDARAVVQIGAVAARDNLYLNLAVDLLQVQQTAIDDPISDCSGAANRRRAKPAGLPDEASSLGRR
jgi:hypothetical protein